MTGTMRASSLPEDSQIAPPPENSGTLALDAHRWLSAISTATVDASVEWMASWALNSSVHRPGSRDIARAWLADEWTSARDYPFETGMISPFEESLKALVLCLGDVAMECLYDRLQSRTDLSSADLNVAAQALRIIGDINSRETHAFRRTLLEHNLSAAAPQLRDGAIVGLLHLDDPKSIPAVERVLAATRSRYVRGDLIQLLSQLRETLNAVRTSPGKK